MGGGLFSEVSFTISTSLLAGAAEGEEGEGGEGGGGPGDGGEGDAFDGDVGGVAVADGGQAPVVFAGVEGEGADLGELFLIAGASVVSQGGAGGKRGGDGVAALGVSGELGFG